MPQAIPAVVAAAKALTWKAVGKFVLHTTIATAVSHGVGKLTAKKPSGISGSSLSGSRLDETRDILQAHRIIYGRDRVGPIVRFRHKAGTNGKYLYLGLVWAGHECDAIEQLRFGEETLAFDGSGVSTGGSYAGLVRVTHHLGAWDQTADANFVSELPGVYRTTDRARGRCWTAMRVEWNQDKFPGGLPAITAVIRGRKVYDPRNGAHSLSNPSGWSWSCNPALCEADYMRGVPMFDSSGSNIVRPFGLGLEDGRVINAQLTASANACDEDVALAAGGTENRYELHGSFFCDSDHTSIIAGMESAMAGRTIFIAGEAYIRAGYWEAPDVDLTEAMLRRGQRRTRNPLSRREKFNVITGSYTNPSQNYQRTSFPAVVSNTFISQDGGELPRVLDLPFTASKTMAERLARLAMLRSRQGVFYQAPYNLSALQVLTGQNARISRTLLGWTNKHFEILQLDFEMVRGDRGGVGFGTEITAQETDSSIFDWNTSLEQTFDPAPNTGLWNPNSVQVPQNFAAVVAPAGERTALPRIKVSCDLPTDQFILSGGWLEIEWKKAADSTWLRWGRVPASLCLEYVTDLQVGTSTQFRGRFINKADIPGEFCTPVAVTPQAGLSNYFGALTNDVHGVACNAEGAALTGELGVGGRAVTDVLAWAGAAGLAAVAGSPSVGQFSISAALHSGTATFTKTGNAQVRLDTLTTTSAIIRITINVEGVTTIDLDWTVFKVSAGGAYWITADAAAVNKTIAGAYTPSTVTFRAFAKLEGAAGSAAYAGRFKIASFDGSTWTDLYSSAADESSKTYTVPAGIKALRAHLYLAGSFSTFLDEEVIPITSDGATGTPGTNGTNGATVLGSAGGGGSAASSSYTNISPDLTLTVTCDGNPKVIRYSSAEVANASGSAQTCYVAICDGTTVIAELGNGNGIALDAGDSTPIEMSVAYTPSAGSHTFRIRVKSSAGNSVATGGQLSVI